MRRRGLWFQVTSHTAPVVHVPLLPLLPVLFSAGLWRLRTSLEWAPPAPRWWWPRPAWSLWTARAGGRPYSAAPAWSTAPPGSPAASSDAPHRRGANGGRSHGPRPRLRRAPWTRWGEGGRRRAGRGTGSGEGGGGESGESETKTLSWWCHRLIVHPPFTLTASWTASTSDQPLAPAG